MKTTIPVLIIAALAAGCTLKRGGMPSPERAARQASARREATQHRVRRAWNEYRLERILDRKEDRCDD